MYPMVCAQKFFPLIEGVLHSHTDPLIECNGPPRKKGFFVSNNVGEVHHSGVAKPPEDNGESAYYGHVAKASLISVQLQIEQFLGPGSCKHGKGGDRADTGVMVVTAAPGTSWSSYATGPPKVRINSTCALWSIIT